MRVCCFKTPVASLLAQGWIETTNAIAQRLRGCVFSNAGPKEHSEGMNPGDAQFRLLKSLLAQGWIETTNAIAQRLWGCVFSNAGPKEHSEGMNPGPDRRKPVVLVKRFKEEGLPS